MHRTCAQFARPVHGGDDVAIKFYFEAEAFATEQRLFARGGLRACMPAVAAVEPNPQARALPCCPPSEQCV